MKKLLLILFLTSQAFGQFEPFDFFNPPYQKETIAHIKRVAADGGVVYDKDGLDRMISAMKFDKSYNSAKILCDPNWGVKVDGSGYVSKLYNVVFQVNTTDILSGWNFTNWTNNSAAPITGTSYVTSGAGGITKSGITTAGKAYACTISGTTNTTVNVCDANQGYSVVYSGTFTGSFSSTFKMTAQSTGIYLRNATNGTTTITKLELYEILNPDLEQSTAANQPKLTPYASNSGFSANLLTGDNSTFTAGVGNWVGYLTGAVAFETDHAKLTLAASSKSGTKLSGFNLQLGKTYFISVKARLQSGTATSFVFGRANSAADQFTFTPTSTASTYSGYITVSATGELFLFSNSSNSSVYEIDDVSIQEVTVNTNRYVLTSDGTNDFIKSPLMTLNQSTVVYLGVRQVSWTDIDYIFDGYDLVNTYSPMALYQRTTSPNLRIMSNNLSQDNANLQVGVFGLVKATYNGSGSSIQINNTAATTGTIGNSNAGGFTLGAKCSNSNFGNIEVGTVLIFDAVPTPAQDLRWKNWLMSKWGVK